jgi:nucleotide-binding universal stress UspA family protein
MSEQLLVPLDGSPLADAAIPVAVDIARRLSLDILADARSRAGRHHAISAGDADPHDAARMGRCLSQGHADMAPAARGRSRSHLETSGLRSVSRRQRRRGDCRGGGPSARAIVCSTHGAGGLAPHWLGSVADRLIRHAPCPVIALPPDAPARSDEMRTLLVLLDGSDHAESFQRLCGLPVDSIRMSSC